MTKVIPISVSCLKKEKIAVSLSPKTIELLDEYSTEKYGERNRSRAIDDFVLKIDEITKLLAVYMTDEAVGRPTPSRLILRDLSGTLAPLLPRKTQIHFAKPLLLFVGEELRRFASGQGQLSSITRRLFAHFQAGLEEANSDVTDPHEQAKLLLKVWPSICSGIEELS